ncbi:S1C family serine protease [Bacillus benzoevorans]|uniref:S1-C subfamily serine protease n=1 Tax=Bacillus benzoevorans TaxID=1456 RepID=A0A7X0HP38_9BACI|nr:serine protease [Bacillus benzoevorans]MBB6444367.1 S1-C subfamily serine protease [Bacillus benzoevorans]
MDDFKEEKNEDPFEEPLLEDFLPNKEDERLIERQKKRRSLAAKTAAIMISLTLIVTTLQIWPQLFNLSSLSFLQKSEELSKQEDIQQYKEAVVTIQDQYAKGTGFNISKNGLIITNHHVVDEMKPITISFPDGQIFHASILVSDPDLDLAILRIEGEDLPFITLSKSAKWKPHDHIYVIGNPLLHTQIVNEGKILDGSQGSGVLMISAPVYKGNSGSPVINRNGEVIGVVFAKSTEEPIGYAIPIEKVLEKLPDHFFANELK